MEGVTLHDLADDVASVIRALGGGGRAVLLGHAYGNAVARMIATDHGDLVSAVIIAAASADDAPAEIATALFVAGDTSLPRAERVRALRKAFFAPCHDASAWLEG